MLDGYDHNAPPEVITHILTGFFGAAGSADQAPAG
jgi:hypothetical protein